jgi:VWFA-related protein
LLRLAWAAYAPALLLAQASAPTFRAEPTIVMAPALVTSRSGAIIHGLSAIDFIVEEAGVEQQVHLDDTPESEPISLVVAVQRGGSAYLEFEQANQSANPESGSAPPHPLKRHTAALSGLGQMVENFLGEAKSEVAVVTFDKEISLLQDFTGDVPAVAERLNTLQGSGGGGAAIRDAVAYSVHLLEGRPAGRRRVLLLISEQRDHGSHIGLSELLQQIARSNTLVYAAAFSPSRAELIRDVKGQNPAEPKVSANHTTDQVNLLGPAFMAASAMRKNTARAVAELTGGEYQTFRNKRSFDDNLGLLANHVRNCYLLSFQPANPQPGPHQFTVRLRDAHSRLVVRARSIYWVAQSATADPGG